MLFYQKTKPKNWNSFQFYVSCLICILHIYLFIFLWWQLYLSTGLHLSVYQCVPLSNIPVKCLKRGHLHWKICFSFVPLQQLRANIREMEKLCARVRAEDADALEALVKPVRDRASEATRDFLVLHSNPVPPPASASPPATQPSSCVSSDTDDNVGEEPASGRQIQLYLPDIPADQSAAESWDNLEEVWAYFNVRGWQIVY